jgi:hypothetical protein
MYVSYQHGGYSKRCNREAYFLSCFGLTLRTSACRMFVLARNSLYNRINAWRFTLLRGRQLTSVGQANIYHPVPVRVSEYLSIHLP